jgi:hypothetical protein
MIRATAVLALALAAAPAAAAEGKPRALVVSGVFGVAPAFDEHRTLHLHSERGSIDTTYRGGLVQGAEVGLSYGLGPRLGLQIAAGGSRRSRHGAYAARLPHPLYLDAHRRSEGGLDSLSYLELAGHVGLSYGGRTGTLAYTVFAGPSVYRVRAELIENASTQESYPYDDVTFSLSTARSGRVGPGVHAGASVEYPLAAKLSLGLQTRYCYGRVVLAPNEDDRTRVDAGGPQIALGLRWAF